MAGESPDNPDAARAVALVGGRYRLDGVIGQGGFGVVHRATDELLQRQVAIKEVRLPLRESAEERDLARERVLREARAAGRLHHPGAVAVLDVIDDGELPWIVMEFVDAQSLSKIIGDRGPLPIEQTCRIGISLAYALEAAHRLGVVHRDVKPSNVLVTADGRARLTDFGIAVSHGDPRLTSTGMVLGSPAYLPPERARGDAGSAASDRWGLGATLFTTVEGYPPFTGDDPISVLAALVQGRRQPFRHAGPLAPVIDDLMAPHEAARPALTIVRKRLREIADRDGDRRSSRSSRATRPRPAQISAASPPVPVPAPPVITAPDDAGTGPKRGAGAKPELGAATAAVPPAGATPAELTAPNAPSPRPPEAATAATAVLASAGTSAAPTSEVPTSEVPTSEVPAGPSDPTAGGSATTDGVLAPGPRGDLPTRPGADPPSPAPTSPAPARPGPTNSGPTSPDPTNPGPASGTSASSDPARHDPAGFSPDDPDPARPASAGETLRAASAGTSAAPASASAAPVGSVALPAAESDVPATPAATEPLNLASGGATSGTSASGSPTAAKSSTARDAASPPPDGTAAPAGEPRPRPASPLERMRSMDRMRALGGIPARARLAGRGHGNSAPGPARPQDSRPADSGGPVEAPPGTTGPAAPAARPKARWTASAGLGGASGAKGSLFTSSRPAQTPAAQTPATQAPAAQTPAAQTPAAQAPSAQGPPAQVQPARAPWTTPEPARSGPDTRLDQPDRRPAGDPPHSPDAGTRQRFVLTATALTAVVLATVVGIVLALTSGSDDDSGRTPAGRDGVAPAGSASADLPSTAPGEALPPGATAPTSTTSPAPVVPADPAAGPAEPISAQTAPATAPPGWVSYTDPAAGWSVAYPATWQRREGPGGPGNVDFVDPATRTFLRVGSVQQANTSAIGDWQRNEAGFRASVRDYRRVRLAPSDGGDGTTQADWEFGYRRSDGVMVHVLNRGAIRNGHGYALYWHTREDLWLQDQPLMHQLFGTFRPGP